MNGVFSCRLIGWCMERKGNGEGLMVEMGCSLWRVDVDVQVMKDGLLEGERERVVSSSMI